MMNKLFAGVLVGSLFAVFTLQAAPMDTGKNASGSEGESGKPRNEKTLFNEGLQFLLEKSFRRAKNKFEDALSFKENCPEAHNNLAYCLRKLSADNNEEALTHYNRAIELAPKRPEPYMYRGTLFVLSGQETRAREDLAKLRELKSALADELQWVIENKKEKSAEAYYGVFQKEL
ncbi:MAG: hypothetical protein JNM63_15300 [Spirochaetia bacterium]|nr:hypothetical protein [Spirochaetia bacterium]